MGLVSTEQCMCPGHIFLPLVVTGIYCVPFLLGLGICSLPFSKFRSPWRKFEGMAKAGRGSDFLNERCVRFSLFLEHLQVRHTIPPVKRKWIHVNRYFFEVRLANRNSHLLEIFGMCFYPAQWELCFLSCFPLLLLRQQVWKDLRVMSFVWPSRLSSPWSLSCSANGTKTCQVLKEKG